MHFTKSGRLRNETEPTRLYDYLVKPDDSLQDQFISDCLAAVLSGYSRAKNGQVNQNNRRKTLKSAYSSEGAMSIPTKPKYKPHIKPRVRRAKLSVPQHDSYGDSYE